MIFILLAMLFCHIVDDYYLQGILAKLKQKEWWRSQEGYTDKYRFDYIVGLTAHSFSWAFMIMLPIFIYLSFNIGLWWIAVLINTILHAIIDDLKANRKKINLIQDQIIHIMQIVATWLILRLGI